MKQSMQEMIELIQTANDFDWHGGAQPDDKRFQQFVERIQAQPDISPRDSARSTVETWLLENRNHAWFKTLQSCWNQIGQQSGRETLQSLFQPLLEVMDHLAANMQPAPAYRGGAAQVSLTAKPRRRAIEAADLPLFPALFCTALEDTGTPITLRGLQPGHNYRLTLTCVQDADWRVQSELTASPQGDLKINLQKHLKDINYSDVNNLELVWLLEDINAANPEAWTSGLIWLGGNDVSNKDRFREVLLSSTQENIADDEIQHLIEINLLTRWSQYTQAYELARKRLLSISTGDASGLFPYRDALWQFIEQILEEMIARMQNAQPAFKALKPQWNAVQSLKDLKSNITEWD